MRLASVVEVKVTGQDLASTGDGIVAMQVDLLVLDRLPEPFDEDVVPPAPFAIHADLDRLLLEDSDES
ncbi:hypothetical protein BI364_07510 [Acidihalobacter yilgarnensis]|uniref:Uncharacterized protein n=1 Tax=Acidihalobacter yilgarnensis TaxID=2819280 RepID=A0A1D8IMZ0_9GAMM|nr:hypothetical protein BI364_07510 [Acidihalobacter yilgarnensis]